VVSGAEGDARKVIREAAEEKGSEFRQVGERVERTGSRSMELEMEVAGEVVGTNLVGRYQVDNVDTVLEMVEALPLELEDDDVRRGIGSAVVEGRMEPVSREPLVLLDGAHNPAAVDRLPETLEEVDGGRTISVVSVMEDKDYGEMVSTIEGFSDLLVFSEASIERASDAAELASCAEGTESEVRPSIEEAIESAVGSASPEDTVLFTGSLYFVGDVKKVLEEDGNLQSMLS
ncbi:MAG: glutamate ligase domain-containing protein, partial [Candidatus Nanohaloarchaea archaeon]